MSALRGIGIAWLGVMLCGLPPSPTAAAAPAAPPQRAVVLNAPPPPKRTPSGTMATPGSVALGAIAARAPRGPGRVVLPDHVFVRSPRTFRPFTIREFLTADQYAASVQNKKPPTVTLRRGGTITIDERYVNKINELERDFNQLGYSLRDTPSPTPIPLQSSTLALGTTPDREPTPISGPLAQFAGYNWSKTVGLPSIAALKLHEEMVAVNSPDSLGTDIGASVIVTLLGTDHTVVDLSARSVVPISAAFVDPLRQATVHCLVGVDCGSPSKTGTAPGLLSVANNLAQFDINQKLGIPPIQQTFNTFIGPVPVTVKVGLRSLLGLQLTATADVRDGTASLGPSLPRQRRLVVPGFIA